MKNFLNIMISGRFRKPTESELMQYLSSNKNKIFCAGDIDIYNDYIEWVHGKENSAVRISWEEITQIYVSSESGVNNVNIESFDGRQICFYINNRNNTRDKFMKYLIELAALKGADIT